jgi:hypothetical protein
MLLTGWIRRRYQNPGGWQAVLFQNKTSRIGARSSSVRSSTIARLLQGQIIAPDV